MRYHFTWILDLQKKEGEWEIRVYIRGLEFKIELASHKIYQAKYVENVKKFLICSRSSLPSLGTLGMESHITTAQPSQPLTPRQLPIYISERNLGSGLFRNIDKVIDISTCQRISTFYRMGILFLSHCCLCCYLYCCLLVAYCLSRI